MRYSITKHGDLEITVTRDERNHLKADKDDANFLSDAYMTDFFEVMTANSELEWIAPEAIGALTDAPILGVVRYDGNGGEVYKVWWYPNYMVRSPVQDLLEDGVCIFQKAEVWDETDS